MPVKQVEPGVRIIARTMTDDHEIAEYLKTLGAVEYLADHRQFEEAEDLVEVAGRMCYRSWQPGMNPNVTKVRNDQTAYLENILKSGHGSVLEHVSWTFLLQDISRIVTHELVRHRPGVAISQESMRYVRLDEIPFWLPDWALEDQELTNYIRYLIHEAEKFQQWAAEHFHLDDEGTNFAHKKAATSFMRRLAPSGHATSMVWTANARTLRHVIETRTSPGAEEEIRLVFDIIAEMMRVESPALFGDFTRQDDGSWKPKWSKV